MVSEVTENWSAFQSKLKAQLRKDDFEHWFTSLAFVVLREGDYRKLTLSVATPFLKSWLTWHYLETLLEVASDVFGPVNYIEITVRTIGQRTQVSTTVPPTAATKTTLVAALHTLKQRPQMLTNSHARSPVRTVVPPPSYPYDSKPKPYYLPSAISPEPMETPHRKNRGITLEMVQQLVCEHYAVSNADFSTGSNKPEVVLARNVAIYLSIELTDESYMKVGHHFTCVSGTIMSSRNKIRTSLSTDVALKASIDYLKAELLARKE